YTGFCGRGAMGVELLRVLYTLFMGSFLIIAGVLTYTSKGEPGIGFRIGYTYLSERARRKANRVAGIMTIATGAVLIIAGLLSSVAIAYIVAKREYELEELSLEAPAGKEREIKPPNVRKHLTFQLLCLIGVLLLSPKLPRESTLFMCALILLFISLTIFASRPLVFQLAPGFKGRMAEGFALSMSCASLMLLILATAEAFNVSTLGGLFIGFLALGVLFYGVFKALVSSYEEGYY
ncbi:SdpI family protein, partial [Thermococcus sp.]